VDRAGFLNAGLDPWGLGLAGELVSLSLDAEIHG
jgi:hypothetical protein